MKFYKGYKGESKKEDEAIYKELNRLKSIVHERKSEVKFQASDYCNFFLFFIQTFSLFLQRISEFVFFFSVNGPALKGLAKAISLTTLSTFTANHMLINYSVMVFERAETPIDPYLQSIFLAFALILGSLSTTYFADILGRKILCIISFLGSAFGLLSLSLYHYLHLKDCDLSAFGWVPVASLSFVIFISAAGVMPLSMICGIEYLPPKVRVVLNVILFLISKCSFFHFFLLFSKHN